MVAVIDAEVRDTLVRVAVAIAVDRGRGGPALCRALERAAEGSAGPWVEEVVLQSHLFLGYPAALAALALWRRQGVVTPEPSPPETPEVLEERGRRVLARVYGTQTGPLLQNVQALHPDLARWMVVDGYGKVLGRPGLPLRERELAILAQLAVLGATEPLYSHLRGALHAGATPDEIERALALALPEAAADERETILRTWERVQARPPEAPGSARTTGSHRVR